MTTGNANRDAGVRAGDDASPLPVENPLRTPAPAWAPHLVLCEFNPRGFTSPDGAGDGHGSGTFRSAAEKLPHLADLGVNGIWLAGFHEATDHFYGVWSVYAARRHDRFDPALGTADDFRHFVDTAHGLGIRVLLEVISHGVLHDSPFVTEHPDWFLPHGSWGMRDFDYAAPGFRTWWKQLWTGYVTEFGVDGFRVDLTLGDVRLWDEMTRELLEAGSPVLVMGELERYHCIQREPTIVTPDMAGDDWTANDQRLGVAQLSCHDNGWLARPGDHYGIRGSRSKLGYHGALSPRIPLFYAGDEFAARQEQLPAVRRGLFGHGGPGGWMYGCQVPWHQLEEDEACRAFLEDARRLFGIRREYGRLLNADRWSGEMVRVPTDDDPSLVPYARFTRGREAIVVAANEDDEPVTRRLHVPVDVLGLSGPVHVTDLWHGGSRTVPAQDLAAGWEVVLGPDHAPRGGLAVLHLERAS